MTHTASLAPRFSKRTGPFFPVDYEAVAHVTPAAGPGFVGFYVNAWDKDGDKIVATIVDGFSPEQAVEIANALFLAAAAVRDADHARSLAADPPTLDDVKGDFAVPGFLFR